MHKLARQVRFSINPFLPCEGPGYNSYASKPPPDGLAIFFELGVEITGEVEPSTGFVVNVLDIDEIVRRSVVPVFGERIRKYYGQCRHVTLFKIVEVLRQAWSALADKFGPAELSRLTLALDPFRRFTLDKKDDKMIYFSEKFEFAAMHKLWNDGFSEERNRQVFGKCANPAGHGHNYVVEVTVVTPEGDTHFRIGAFEKTVDEGFIKLVDHRNLNVDVAELAGTNPTVENIAALAWEKLVGRFGEAVLHCVTVWETDKTYCSYMGQ